MTLNTSTCAWGLLKYNLKYNLKWSVQNQVSINEVSLKQTRQNLERKNQLGVIGYWGQLVLSEKEHTPIFM